MMIEGEKPIIIKVETKWYRNNNELYWHDITACHCDITQMTSPWYQSGIIQRCQTDITVWHIFDITEMSHYDVTSHWYNKNVTLWCLMPWYRNDIFEWLQIDT